MIEPRHPAANERAMRAMFVLMFLFGGAAVTLVVWLVRQAPRLSLMQVTSWQYAFLVLLLVGTLISIIRRIQTRLFWEVLFTLTLFLGIWYLFLLVLPLGWALLAASLLTLSHLMLRTVVLHDLFYLLGAAGVAIDFAGWLSPELLLLALVIFSIYDMLAGPPGGPIEDLARRLVKQGVVPGVVVASRFRDLFVAIDEAMKRNASLLGAGDLILPLALVARAAFAGMEQALIVLAGILVSAILLARGEMHHPRAILPVLAAGAAIPFVVLRLLARI